ncbi:gliding motility lipoprotein GldH [Cellulophaga baltica]|uniref:gliding motility lipoprotein GldH n=1 Tax=Cellulophaga TaxID=104264 RepID=UPI001C07D7C2|nr:MULTISPECIES: gliding motility lipoprotein GldH [Cellulophaga]MBU2995920.1 gliding motility lipoprotein GldH [Cellulophaga baltica]MDO6767315.1 gliding motility lipoprotein GldH [Cellulophaga sp. 1_MG-2023]
MTKYFFSLLILTLLASCNGEIVKSEYKTTSDGSWEKDDSIEFKISDIDTIQSHNVFINLRNDETFAYSNIFLIAELDYPNGASVKDTLEYEMTLPDGQWLGKGYGSIKENKLWYKENFVFPTQGVYSLKISHAMRKNGKVNGIIDLEGITDVGYQIEKSNK